MGLNQFDDAVDRLPDTAPASPWDAAIDKVSGTQSSLIDHNVREAAKTPPDRQAEIFAISERLGIPTSAVRDDFDAMQARVAEPTPVSLMQTESPALAAALEDQEIAALTQDDRATLGWLEYILTEGGEAAVLQGQAQNRVGELETASIFRDLTADERAELETAAAAMTAPVEERWWFDPRVMANATLRIAPGVVGGMQASAQTGISGAVIGGTSMALLGPAAPVAVIPATALGGTFGAAVGLFEFSATREIGLNYREFREFKDEFGNRIDPEVAKVAAVLSGSVSGLGEVVQFGLLARLVPALGLFRGTVTREAMRRVVQSPVGRSALKALGSVLLTTAQETGVELAQELVNVTGLQTAIAVTNIGRRPPGQALTVTPLEPGNIDLTERPAIENPDGSRSTLRSMSVGDERGEVLIPTIVDGVQVSPDEAIAHHQATGEHLGIFRTPADATAASKEISEQMGERPVAPIRPSELVARLGETLVGSVQAFPGLVAPFALFRAGVDVRRAQEAQRQAADYDLLAEAAAQSKTIERSPAVAQELLDQADPEARLYLPVDTFTEYFQGIGEDPAAKAVELTGDPEAFAQATATGEDLQITKGAYTVQLAPTEHHAFFRDELRAAPEAANAREGVAFVAALDAEVDAQDPADPATESIRTNVQATLEAAAFPPDEATLISEKYTQVLTTMAGRAGVDAAGLAAVYDLQVTREGVTPEIPDAQRAAATGGEGLGPRRRPPGRRVAESVGVAGESDTAQATRRETHFGDVFAAVLADAQAVDPSVDETTVRAEFTDRVEALTDLEADYRDSGQSPRSLLEAIASHGGISLAAEEHGGLAGELRWVRQSPAFGTFGAFGGVPRVFRTRRTQAGQATQGLSLDDMVGMLRQAPEFAYLENINDLLAALEDVSRLETPSPGVTFPGTRELARAVGIRPGESWWDPTSTLEQGPVPLATPGVDPGREAAPVNPTSVTVARTLAEGETLSADDRAHGLYVSLVQDRETFASPHVEPGDQTAFTIVTPQNPLVLADETIAHARFGRLGEGPASAGVLAVKRLTTAETFERLRTATKADLATEIATRWPDLEVTHNEDAYELLEVIGAQLAREAGHDAIVLEDEVVPALSEMVVLSDAILGEAQPDLPGAREIADATSQDPTVAEAPFGLTPPPRRGPAGSQGTLFQSAPTVARSRAELEAAGFDTSRQFFHQTTAEAATTIREEGFDVDQIRARRADSMVPDGVFFKPDATDIGLGDAQVSVYLRFGETLTVADREALADELEQDEAYAALAAEALTFDEAQAVAFDALEASLEEALTASAVAGTFEAADQQLEDFLKTWNAGNAERAAAARARATEVLRDRGIETVVIARDEGSLGRVTETIIVLSGDQVADVDSGRVLFQPADGGDVKRGRIVFGDRSVRIDLFKTANLSTIHHEMGHFYLRVLTDLVADLPTEGRTAQQQQLADDLASALAWLGVEDETKIGVAQHEQWARGYEAYLREGRAPTAALQSMFARFRAWFVSVYRHVSELNVELTDEIRGVMDRLVATDDAIAAAESEAGVEPLFLTADSVGMTEAAFVAYRAKVAEASVRKQEDVQRSILAEQEREQKAWWRTARAAVKADVTAAVHAEPVYRALAAIRRGTKPDGTALVEGENPSPLKLAKQDIIDQCGRDCLKRLSFLYVREGGQDLAQVAEMFGFDSGNALAQALMEAPPMAAVITEQTDARMTAEFGDMRIDGRLAEEAQAAVSGEHQEEIVRAELAALEAAIVEGSAGARGAITRGVLPTAAFINAAAAERIGRMQRRDLRPGVFLQAAHRASRRASDLLARNEDRAGALAAKYQELLNLALYREGRRVRDDIDTRVRWVADHNTPKARARTGLAGESYLDQWDGFLDRYEFARVTQTTLDRRASLRTWVASQEASGTIPIDFPDTILDEQRQNYQEMVIDEFIGVVDAMRQLLHRARFKNKLLLASQQRTLAEARGQVADTIARWSAGGRPPEIETGLPGVQSLREWAADNHAWVRKLGSMIRTMDGDQDGGVIWTMVMQLINQSSDTEQVEKHDLTLALAKLNEAFDPEDLAQMSTRVFLPAIGRSITRGARLMVGLNYGNKEGRQQVHDGEGWSPEQAQAVIDSLDAKDWQWINGTVTLVNSYWPRIEAKEKRVKGVAPKKVEALPIPTRDHGTQPGGYFRIKANPELSDRGYAQSVAEVAKDMMRGAASVATTQRGHTNERLELTTRSNPLWLDPGLVVRHLNEVVHDLTHHEMLLDVTRIMGHRTVTDAIREHYGQAWNNEIRQTIRDIAAGTIPVERGGQATLNRLVRGTSVARMGWNLMTMTVQPLGLLAAIPRVGVKWVGKGVAAWMHDAVQLEATVARVHAESVMMRFRHTSHMRELAEIDANISPRGAWAAAAVGDKIAGAAGARAGFTIAQKYAVIQTTYFYLIGKGQLLADMPVYLGAKEKALAGGETEARAQAIAEQTVTDTQGSGLVKDLARAQRDPHMKIWTQFYNYMSVILNLTAETVEARRRLENPITRARLIVNLAFLLGGIQVIELAMREALRGGEDDDDSTFAERALRAQVGFILGLVPIVREASGAVEGYQYSGPAGTGFFDEMTRFIARNVTIAFDEDQEFDFATFVRNANQVGGILFHWPSTELERIMRAVMVVAEDPEAAFSALFGGRPES